MIRMDEGYYSDLSNRHDIPSRYKAILDQMQDIIKAEGIQDKVQVNEDLLGKAIIDYFEDIDRLKQYEEIDRIKTSKIYAYETYWLVRRKPIQIIGGGCEEKYLYINELACTMMIIIKMHKEANVEIRLGDEQLGEFTQLLYYNLRYRKFTQQSLELMIEAFYLGCSRKKTKEG